MVKPIIQGIITKDLSDCKIPGTSCPRDFTGPPQLWLYQTQPYETDENNQVVASYTYGPANQPVSMTRGGKTYYYQLNGHGDVTALTDSTGAVVATYESDAWGNVLKETGTVDNPYRYLGYRYDKATKLYYLQARYYNRDTGRFLTLDPDP